MIFFLLSYLIFWSLSCICLSIDKHASKVYSKKIISHFLGKRLNLLGYITLFMTLTLAIYQLGSGVGIVYFFATFSLAHFCIIVLLSYQPNYLLFSTGFWLLNRSIKSAT